MNLEHWAKVYEGTETQVAPSPFARWTQLRTKRVLDVGCGVGRDSYFLAQANLVTAVDQCAPTRGNDGPGWCAPRFVRSGVRELLEHSNPCVDVVYARFFFHACDEATQTTVLRWVAKRRVQLYAEFRSDEDKPLRLDHSRRLINGKSFISTLWGSGLHLDYYKEGYNLARFEGENPHIIRIIAHG